MQSQLEQQDQSVIYDPISNEQSKFDMPGAKSFIRTIQQRNTHHFMSAAAQI